MRRILLAPLVLVPTACATLPGEALLLGIESYDQLTLSVYPAEDGRPVLRVVASGYEVETGGETRGSRVSRTSSARADEDAQTILRRCGQPGAARA